MDALVARAKDYAQKLEVPGPGVALSREYLLISNEYLRKDKTACALSDSMARVFAQMGNAASAKIFLDRQSI